MNRKPITRDRAERAAEACEAIARTVRSASHAAVLRAEAAEWREIAAAAPVAEFTR